LEVKLEEERRRSEAAILEKEAFFLKVQRLEAQIANANARASQT
jgi:hypothetical protein